MSLWLPVGLLTLAIIALLSYPLWRGRAAATARDDYDLNVYRDQLTELDRDTEEGRIDAEQAEAARHEIQHRLLKAGELRDAENAALAKRSASAAPKVLTVVLAVLIPAGTLGLYLYLGSPTLKDLPLAEREDRNQIAGAEGHGAGDQMNSMIASLAARLEANPDDVEGWLMLGKSYRAVNRLQDAANAYRRAMEFSKGASDITADYAEILVILNQGQVPPIARRLFEHVAKTEPVLIKPAFYVGLAKFQEGEYGDAIQDWVDMIAIAAPDAPWIPDVQRNIDMAAEEGKINLASIKPSPRVAKIQELIRQRTAAAVARQSAAKPLTMPGTEPKPVGGPSAADVAAAQEMTEDDRTEMIQTMVNKLATRLKDNPNDAQGWVRLGRSYMVLGELDKGRDALAKAAQLSPKNKDVVAEYASAIIAASANPDQVTDQAATVYKDVLALDANDVDALWYVGLNARQNGETDANNTYWQRLLGQFDESTLPYVRLKERMDAVGAR